MLDAIRSIRPGERATAFAAFATLFAVMTAHLLMETARDTLFLASIPAAQLPWMYLAIAAFAFGLSRLERRVAELARGDLVLTGWLVIGAVGTLVFWLAIEAMGEFGLYALYVWPGVLITLTLIQFWTLLGGLLTVHDAKRVYIVVGAGGVLGAIAGSGAATLLTSISEPRHLLVAASSVLVCAAAGPLWMHHTRGDSGGEEVLEPRRRLTETLRRVLDDPYAVRVGLLVLVATVAATVGDFIFKSTADRIIENSDLGIFFGGVYFFLNVLSFLVQLFVVRWAVRRVSVAGALSVLPALLFLGGAGVAAGAALVAAVGIKLVDGALRHSLHDTSLELLYVPLDDQMRPALKAFAGVFAKRGGQAVASLGILALIAMETPPWVLGLVLAGLAGLWIAAAFDLKHHYLDIFRNTLGERTFERSIDFPDLDMQSLQSLIARLDSQDDDDVLAVLDILDEEERAELVPALILYHPSDQVVCRALRLYAHHGVDTFLPVAERISARASVAVRAEIVAARTAVAPDAGWLRLQLADEDATVRQVAGFHLAAHGWDEVDALPMSFDEAIREGDSVARRSLARAIGLGRAREHAATLIALSRTDDTVVRRECVGAMEQLGEERFVPPLTRLLADREVRAEVRHALVALAEPALLYLRGAFDDPSLPRPVRWELPRAVAAFRSQAAADALTERLPHEDDGMVRYRIVRELERLRLRDRGLPLEMAALRRACERHLELAYRFLDWRMTLQRNADEEPSLRTPVHGLLVALLRDKEGDAIEVLVRILALMHPEEDFGPIFRGMGSSDAAARASSMELLTFIVPPDVRGPVLGLVDDAPDRERIREAGEVYTPVDRSYDAMLSRFLDDSSRTLTILAALQVAELGRDTFIPRLERAYEEAAPGSPLAENLCVALQRLKRGTADQRSAGRDGAKEAGHG